jgi:hypothetical protein
MTASSPVPHVPNSRCAADVLHRDGDAVPRPQLWQVNLRFLLKSSKKTKIILAPRIEERRSSQEKKTCAKRMDGWMHAAIARLEICMRASGG